MAVTKNPLIRYKILDSCFRNPYKKFTKELLLETINNKLIELFDDESHCIKLRQMQDDIAFMKSAEGWNIELAEEFESKKRIFRYEDLNFSINNAPLNETELNEFQSAIQVLSQFEGMPQFEGIQEIIAKLKYDLKSETNQQPFIGFDTNQDLKGMEYFSLLYNAAQKQIPLQITYQDFKAEQPYTFIFHPYYLKQYNNRWFIFGLHEETMKPDWNVAIDRIVSIEASNAKFIPNTTINWTDYFSDMIGVSKPIDGKIEEIVLHFNQLTGKYMENKPLHETQKHKWINNETLEVKIKVIPNYELARLILSYGDSVKVIQPKYLRERIKNKVENNAKLYG
ncbi:WYL domain-containing protein [Flavobacterium chungnamense]|uniref:WYL domain-containing protein n=1 Tax=Flavobacterium chungnamense TaxID=706182 RepID=A0ABP7V567_9FLAO